MANAWGGQEMYAAVQEYSALGNHWTGTDVDANTRQWIIEQLAAMGADVAELNYGFDRYAVQACTVTSDQIAVPSIPLFYEGAADLDTDKVYVAPPTDVGVGLADPGDLSAIIAAATRGGADVAVIPTAGPTGDLVAINRAPQPGSGTPVVLAPAAAADQLCAGQPRVRVAAQRQAGITANVVGTWGGGSAPPVVIVTPLTGWFHCAGERGTGIAIALALAAELARERPVALVGTTGHEIGFLGVQQLTPADMPEGALFVHLGASAAACDAATGQLSPQRWLLSSGVAAGGNSFPSVAGSARLQLAGDPATWVGEGRWLREWNRPIVSIAGHFPLFHTPRDLPEQSTTPSLLTTVYSGLLALIRDLQW